MKAIERMDDLFKKHKNLIDRAVEAIHQRRFYTPYPEHHKAYPQEQQQAAIEWFEKVKNQKFQLEKVEATEWLGEEVSPFTQKTLGIEYPVVPTESLINQAKLAKRDWKKISVDNRAGFLAEVLDQMKDEYFHFAVATEHTAGQSFMMAFQASGPHSADRALEATALAWQELKRFPEATEWVKPMGKMAIELNKEFRPIGRGIGLSIGCSTFPVWNSIPGIFANIMCDNPVIAKPHPSAVLPMAVLIQLIRKIAVSAGANPDIIQLAVDSSTALRTEELMNHEAIQLIDYTGGSSFGEQVEKSGKVTFTEKSGVNSVLLNSVKDLDVVLQNLAFSAILYSGQMCTSPQNFFIPEDGILEGEKVISFDEFTQRFKKAVEGAVNNPKLGPGTLAAIQSETTVDRVKKQSGSAIELSDEVAEMVRKRRFAVPTINVIKTGGKAAYQEELFGPIVNLIQVKNREEGLYTIRDIIQRRGCITTACYTQDAAFKTLVKDELEEVGAGVSFNLTGYIWVNQASAFSDFHVTGGNPAGNASFVNPEFVVKRFFWVGHRELKKA